MKQKIGGAQADSNSYSQVSSLKDGPNSSRPGRSILIDEPPKSYRSNTIP